MRREIFLSFFQDRCKSFSLTISHSRIHGITGGKKKRKRITNRCIRRIPPLYVKQYWLVTSVELNLTPFRVSFNSNLSIIAPLLNIISQRKKRYLFFQDHCKSFSLTIPHFYPRIYGITGEEKKKKRIPNRCITRGTSSLYVKQHWLVTSSRVKFNLNNCPLIEYYFTTKREISFFSGSSQIFFLNNFSSSFSSSYPRNNRGRKRREKKEEKSRSTAVGLIRFPLVSHFTPLCSLPH